MEIIWGIDKISSSSPSAVTIGTFDGVHRGHKKIISELLKKAGQKGLCSTLITFDLHPRTVIKSGKQISLITAIEEKLELLKQTGLERVLVIHFDKKFSQIHYKDFVKDVLIDKLNMKACVIGYDHSFGKNREGNFSSLGPLSRQYGFSLDQVDPYEADGQLINSTIIRQFLADGDVALAGRLLGQTFSISGHVVHGSERGRSLSYPTANLEPLHPRKVRPGNGVYAVDVEYNGAVYKGMANIGFKPTFEELDAPAVEVHIFDFNKSIYGENINVFFKKRLRSEKKFDSSEDLIAQLEIDKEESLKI